MAMAERNLNSFGQSRLLTIFKIQELRQKIFITLLFLAIYRVGFHIPLPMIDQAEMAEGIGGGSDEGMLGLISMFSGGNLSQSTIFGLGIMPYISASIIFQLLASVYPPLEKLQKEGESGPQEDQRIHPLRHGRHLLVPGLVLGHATSSEPQTQGGPGLALEGYDSFWYMLTSVVIMTAGTVFLMWIGEQIDEYGIGNGISLIIMAGIVARIPDATYSLLFENGHLRAVDLHARRRRHGGDISFEKIIILICPVRGRGRGVIAITKGQRRIPTQSAKHVRGRRVYGGTRQFLPLRSTRPASCRSSSPAAC